jgi:hypothetical protein
MLSHLHWLGEFNWSYYIFLIITLIFYLYHDCRFVIDQVYEIPFLDINPVLSLIVGAVPISWVAKQLTENVFFTDPLVAVGPCPNCGAENRIFFGDVLGVEVTNF